MIENIAVAGYRIDTSKELLKILLGLRQPFKQIYTQFVYDENGSKIYDKICQLPEYYPAWQEIQILQDNINDITSLVGENCLLIEYGSGSSDKTRILLNHLLQLSGYIPIDISEKHLRDSVNKITKIYPNLEVLPVCANYHDYFDIPSPKKSIKNRLAFISGITLGNEHPSQVVTFLQKVKQTCGANGAMLVSIDLKKKLEILHTAYNDSNGLNAAMGLNFLERMNREFNANFKICKFHYQSIYNEQLGRMEMNLISLDKQTVSIGNHCFEFKQGEPISIAYSYKYTLSEFANLARQGGWEVNRVWTDSQNLFSVQYLTVSSTRNTIVKSGG